MRRKNHFENSESQNYLKGVKFLIGSGLAFSLMSVCVKAIGEKIPISELVFARASICLILTRLLLLKNNINPYGYNRKLLVISVIFSSKLRILHFSNVKKKGTKIIKFLSTCFGLEDLINFFIVS